MSILYKDASGASKAIKSTLSNDGEVPHNNIDLIAAGENHLGAIGGEAFSYTPAIVISTSAYAAGDSVGGKQTLTGVMRAAAKTGILHSLTVIDENDQRLPFDLLIFSADPSAAALTDNAPVALSTDSVKVLGKVTVAGTDYSTIGTKAVATITNLGLLVKPASTVDLYAAIVARAAATYTGTSSLTLRYGFLRD